jgi:hypothetical protein
MRIASVTANATATRIVTRVAVQALQRLLLVSDGISAPLLNHSLVVVERLTPSDQRQAAEALWLQFEGEVEVLGGISNDRDRMAAKTYLYNCIDSKWNSACRR